MSDFERTRMGVLGREVTVTSWLDPQTGAWRASAPGVTLDLAQLHRWPRFRQAAPPR